MTNPRWARWVLRAANIHRLFLCALFGVIGPRAAYVITRFLARVLYWLLPPLRWRCEGQCHAALAGFVPANEVEAIARRSFVHRVWNNTDLLLANRLLHPRTIHRYGGRISEPELQQLLAAQRRGQPIIFVSAYYGPFDLLPLFLGFNGIRAGVVYRPHANAAYDEFRSRIRSRSGCELIPVSRALERAPQILRAGGSVAVIADIYDPRRGLPVRFLALPTQVSRFIGLLAVRHRADIVVAGIRRVSDRFQFELDVTEVIRNVEWAEREQAVDAASDASSTAAVDAVAHITRRYMKGIEKLVLKDPAQYLWLHAAWGEERAVQLMQAQPETGELR